MATTLQTIAHEYLSDEAFQESRRHLAEMRDASIPALQAVIHRFIAGETDMKAFCKQLDKTLRAGEDWGATGFGFIMELNKFVKYHLNTTNAPEAQFRTLLTGLNASNLGQRIEQCYAFLLDERKRLQQEGKSSGMIVAVNRSAFIISLFACWLDPDDEPLVYYDTVRKGLFKLIKENAISKPPILNLGADAVEVRRASDHATCMTMIGQIAEQAPSVKTGRYWAEYFCLWITQSFQTNLDMFNAETTLIKDTDNKTEVLSTAPTKQTIVRDKGEPYLDTGAFEPKASDAHIPRLANEPLRAVPETLLARLIREVQRRILVDESTIRRIYYALLAGHVILTGPPGTGKTDLARLIPELLWRSSASDNGQNGETGEMGEIDETDFAALNTETAYTARLVTANDDWSVRTLISGIVPQSENGSVSYKMQYGYLTNAILKNWHFQGNAPAEWSMVTLNRTSVTTPGGVERGTPRTFRGQWLVIDEFNRAPIDLALGDALTALSGNSDETLRVPIDGGGTAELPIPKDFRILGTLNSFDRSYLNQISEALKRRFSFIEVLPPTRAMRTSEQSIVLYKALSQLSHLTDTIDVQDNTLYWLGEVEISHDATELFSVIWDDDEQYAFHAAFEVAWRTFEVIRIYRQLGTAQAINLFKQMLIPGILQGYTTRADWLNALDYALCDSIADQLQVLLPDEIETLLLYLTTTPDNFSTVYHRQLIELVSRPQRLYGQLLALNNVSDEQGQPMLSDAEVERIATQSIPTIDAPTLTKLFHLEQPHYPLPQFTRRLRTFKAERGL